MTQKIKSEMKEETLQLKPEKYKRLWDYCGQLYNNELYNLEEWIDS